ncbi:MAG: GNAT family N-acetyltransferase [Parvularculaceae bacterium]
MARKISTLVSIRAARRADLDRIDAIEARSFAADRFSRAAIARLLASPAAAVLVANTDRGLAGYAAVLFRRGAGVARLYSIAVDPDARGLGAAQALVAAAEGAARRRGADRLRLEVRASNTPARSLYDRAGFTFLEQRPGYYTDGEDAIRLEKRLLPKAAGGRGGV